MESGSLNKGEEKVIESKNPRDELELAVGDLTNSVVLSGGNEEQDIATGLQSASGSNIPIQPTGRFS